MSIVVGGDHAGFSLKGPVAEALRSWGHEVNDVGSYTPDPVDFPDIAAKLCDVLLSGEADRGVMVCGTGVGASIATNRVPGIRSALCHDVYSAHQCVEHDNVNVLCVHRCGDHRNQTRARSCRRSSRRSSALSPSSGVV